MKRKMFLFFATFFLFFFLSDIDAYAISVESVYLEDNLELNFDSSKNAYYVIDPIKFDYADREIPSKYTVVEVERDNVKVDFYEQGKNFPSDRRFYFDENGKYQLSYKENHTTNPVFARFTITGGSEIPDDGTGTNPTPEPTPAIDYTQEIRNVRTSITNLTSLIETEMNTVSSKINSVINGISSTNSKLDSTNSKLDSTNTHLNSINNTIKSNFSTAFDKMDTSNSLLSGIKGNLETTQTAPSQSVPDYSKKLDNNRPVQNLDSYQDDKKYFDSNANITISDEMPQAGEPKQWEGVSEPVAMEKEEEFSKDVEKESDLENVQDIELSKEEIAQDEQLSKDDMAQDVELSKEEIAQDEQLSKDDMGQDVELSKEEMARSDELTTEDMTQSGELSKDEFNSTDHYQQNNGFEQTEFYNQTENDYGLRWKSENGVFK